MSRASGGVGIPDPTRVARDVRARSVVTWLDPGPVTSGPLSGVSVGVKDNIAVAGAPRTCASEFALTDVSAHDAAVVTTVRRAGAAVVATLDMAEWAVGVTSQNSVHGGPRNPWDTTRVPGGSSGGSGAAVAAGVVDVALGTDTGGSTRLPAAACGVTGLRPTPGTIDQTGIVPVSPAFDTVGPIAREASLVRRVHDVLASTGTPPQQRPLRIGVPRAFVTDDVDPGVRGRVDQMVALLAAEGGHTLVPVDVAAHDEAQSAVYTFIYRDLVAFHAERLRDEPDRFQPETLARLRLGLALTDRDVRAARRVRDRLRAGLRTVFVDVDVVLTPTLPVDVPSIDAGADALERTRRMGQFSYPWSLHDGPTLSLPVGFHPESGLPVGVQLTAPAHGESVLFDLAEEYQRLTDWHRREPSA